MQAFLGGSALRASPSNGRCAALLLSLLATHFWVAGAVTRPHTDTALRVHVAETVPKEFRGYLPDDIAGSGDGLIREAQGEADASLGYLHWADIDWWFCSHLAKSTLHVQDIAHADLVFVPLSVSLNFLFMDAFIQEADKYLPLLRTKPHVLVLPFPMMVHFQRNASFIEHPNSKAFTFVVLDHVQGRELVFPKHGERHFDASNYVIAPYPAHVHWGYKNNKRMEWSEMQRTLKEKQRLAFECFVVRYYPDRFASFESCIARPNQCLHSNFSGDTRISDLKREQGLSWYTIHPMGDHIVRNSLYDTFMWLSIPVMFEDDIIEHLPFNDVLDYSMLLKHVEKSKILGGSSENVADVLQKDFDTAEAEAKLVYMYKVHHVFQYAMEPLWKVVSFTRRNVLAEEDDALTFTLKAVLRNICTRGMLHRKCRLQ